MQSSWIILALLLWSPTADTAQLDDRVLANMVSAFQRTAGIAPSDQGGGQFSFLIVLTPDQCTNSNLDLVFTPHRPNSRDPEIRGRPQFFLNTRGANYIAVFPNRGSQCSEAKILHPQTRWNPMSAAQTFLNNVRNQQTAVGCVVFYTTYTPCTNRCFSNDQNLCIVQPIVDLAAQLNNQNIGKYLVFSRLYRYDWQRTTVVAENLGKVAESGFDIRKCDRNGNVMACEPCPPPNYCVRPTNRWFLG